MWGLLADRYHVRNLIIVQGILTALATLVLLFVANLPMAIFTSIFQAFALAGYVTMQPLIWANFYGRQHLGAIRGTFSPFATVSTALGPYAVAQSYDTTGSYKPAFIVLLVTWLMVAGFFYLARPITRSMASERPSEKQPT